MELHILSRDFCTRPSHQGCAATSRFASENTLVVLIVFLAINLWTINFNDDYARQGERENSSKVDGLGERESE